MRKDVIEELVTVVRELSEMPMEYGVAQCLCEPRDDDGRFQPCYSSCPKALKKAAASVLKRVNERAAEGS